MATFTRSPQTYAAIFIDAIAVKARDGQIANRPFYAARIDGSGTASAFT